MSRSLLRALVVVALAVVIIVLAVTGVFPSIGSGNYWWVVLAFVIIVFCVKLYWRVTTGSWNNPRSRQRPQ